MLLLSFEGLRALLRDLLYSFYDIDFEGELAGLFSLKSALLVNTPNPFCVRDTYGWFLVPLEARDFFFRDRL